MWTSIQCVCVFYGLPGNARGLGLCFWVSHSYPGSTRSFQTMPSMRLHLLGGVTWFLCPNMGALTSSWSHGLNTRCWLVETISAALWLVSTILSLLHYCWFFSTTLNDLLTTVLTSYVLFTRSLSCAKWIRSDTEMDHFCSHGTASFHEQSVYTEPFCCCPLLEAQVETRTGPRRHRIVYMYKKAEYLIGVLRTCTRPFKRYCCCRFSPLIWSVNVKWHFTFGCAYCSSCTYKRL